MTLGTCGRRVWASSVGQKTGSDRLRCLHPPRRRRHDWRVACCAGRPASQPDWLACRVWPGSVMSGEPLVRVDGLRVSVDIRPREETVERFVEHPGAIQHLDDSQIRVFMGSSVP